MPKQKPRNEAHTRYYVEIEGKKIRVKGTSSVVGMFGWNTRDLVAWANRMGLNGIDTSKYTDDKARIGTLAHQMIMDHLTGVKKTDTDDYSKNQIDAAENSFISYLNWESGHKVKVHWVEEPLVSKKYMYGGTPDIYWQVDGKDELADIKTGSGIYHEMFIQVGGGYTLLLAENSLPFKGVRILNVPRDEAESFQERIITDWIPICQKIFIHGCDVYELKKELPR
jgi:hypothetical protein